MKAIVCAAVALIAVSIHQASASESSAHAAHHSKVTPVQKVIQMMQGMLAKGQEEKHTEEVQFASYKQFCDDTKAEKESAIQTALAEIDVLKADIDKAVADIERFTTEIADHEEDIAVWAGDKKAATKVRKIEKEDFEKLHQDYSESLDALARAIKTLKKQAPDVAQEPAPAEPTALLQVARAMKRAKLIPDDVKRSFTNFLSEDDSDFSEAPEANAYEFQSAGIVTMLEELETKFFDERTSTEEREANSDHAYNMLMNELNTQTAQAEGARDEKAKTKSKEQATKATKEGDLERTLKDKDEDTKYLNDLTATCTKKASDFENRQELREEELEAIQQAIQIIDGDIVKGGAEKHLPSSFAQQPTTSLAFLRAHVRQPSQQESKVRFVKFLQSRATSLNSRVLQLIATRAAVGEDPFLKLKKMIKDMVQRLTEEAQEEAEHKGWCDTELGTNENTRTSLSNEIDTLKSEIDSLEASTAQLTEEVALLSHEVTDVETKMGQATALRTAEKDKNEETVKDAQDAQAAVAQALTVLREFYNKASGATSFVQQPSLVQHSARAGQPEIFDEKYTGMQGESGGVIGMLEVIQSDFARLQAETEAAEVTGQREYDQFMQDSEVDKTEKNTNIGLKQGTKSDQEIAVGTKREDLHAAEVQMETALAYFDKLKESCLAENVDYDERVRQRESEIESLQEALKILSGEDIA